MQVDLLHADLQPLQVLRPQLVHLELASYHETLSWCTGAHLAWKCTWSHVLGCAHPGCHRLAIPSLAQQFCSYTPAFEDGGIGAIYVSCEPSCMSIAGFTALTCLSLRGCSWLQPQGLGMLRGLLSLRALDLSEQYDAVSDEAGPILASLPSLEALNLALTNVGDLLIDALTYSRRLAAWARETSEELYGTLFVTQRHSRQVQGVSALSLSGLAPWRKWCNHQQRTDPSPHKPLSLRGSWRVVWIMQIMQCCLG